jgi:very-short-patch-repair endonuclease
MSDAGDMIDPQLLIDRLGGLAPGTSLQEFGISRMRLTKSVRAGDIQRLRAGVYATNSAHPAEREAALHGGPLTCSSALDRHGVWVMTEDGPPHVWIGRRGRAHPHAGCRCVSHYFRGASTFGKVDVVTALVHLHRCEGEESFFASLESALRLRLISDASRGRIREALPQHARWLVDFARTDADSGLESLLRLRMHQLGIRLGTQVVIEGVGRVDFVVDGRLIIEADGKENHDGRSNRHKDLVRDAAASVAGYQTLRFDYAQIIHDWPTVQSAILAALARLSQLA